MSDLFYDMIRKTEPGGQAVMNSTMFYLSIAIFAGTYAAIMAERFPRVFAALIGGGLMIFCGFVTQDEAIREFIDFNTIGLLAGMMILVSIVRMSGFFEAMAVWSVRVTKGRPAELMLLLAAVTAVGSSLIDSVTAVMLLAPVTISLCRRIEEQPYPFLITEVLMSNIGGTALMVGNPPNVMIAPPRILTSMISFSIWHRLFFSLWPPSWQFYSGFTEKSFQKSRPAPMRLQISTCRLPLRILC